MPVELSVEQEGLQALARALSEEADGKKLRRQLATELREASQPAVSEIKASLMSMSSAGLPSDGEPLRSGVAKKIKAEARLTGRSTGARVKARKTQSLRGFANAAKRINSRKGWRHRTFGLDVWVRQIGKPGFFDDPLEDRRDEWRRAVLAVMEKTAKRITGKVR